MIEYIKLGLTAMLPAVLSIILYLLNKYTKFKNLKKIYKDIIYGVLFGGLAVLGTEAGVPFNGAQINCRDGAVLTAGLFFGWRAGIIAGLIGGIERWFSIYWGVGTLTRVACTISTIFAGFYAAYVRNIMLNDKKPSWYLSFLVSFVMETIHMIMVFVTNMDDPMTAIRVVENCTIPMILVNSLGVLLSAIVITLLSKEKLFEKHKKLNITSSIQNWLLLTVSIAFVISSMFVYRIQESIAKGQVENELSYACSDIVNDVKRESDQNLLNITVDISAEITNNNNLDYIADKYNVREISIIDENGIIVNSNIDSYIGFDMHTGEQSIVFLNLFNNPSPIVQEYGPISSDSSVNRKYCGIKLDNTILQVGLDYEQFESDITNLIDGITENRHIGESGYVMILNKDYLAVSVPLRTGLSYTTFDISSFNESEISEVTINEVSYYLYYLKAEGYYIVSFIAVEDAITARNVSVYANTFLEIIIFAFLFIQIYILIKRVIIDKVSSINKSLSNITSGNLDEKVNSSEVLEFDELAQDINKTVDTLKEYIDEANKRIDTELSLAKEIQSSVLPTVTESIENRKDFDIYAFMKTAKEVGGDFYDFYLTGEDTLNILIADVSGKGIPAAMFMMRAKAQLKSLTESGLSLDEVFTKANKALCEGNDAQMFVTAWQAQINLSSGLVKFVNAGHNPPLIKENGEYKYLKSKAGFVLGGFDGFNYKINELTLNPYDEIYLYTDGVTEATSRETELYGENRLIEYLNKSHMDSSKDICDGVNESVNGFVKDAPQADDITMLSFRYTPLINESIIIEESKISDIPRITEFVENILERLNASMKAVTQIDIAIDEIVSNIINHGYKGVGGYLRVKVREMPDNKMVSISFIDKAIPYNPITEKDPNIKADAMDREVGGLGIYMVKKSMDDMKYKYENSYNILTLRKVIK